MAGCAIRTASGHVKPPVRLSLVSKALVRLESRRAPDIANQTILRADAIRNCRNSSNRSVATGNRKQRSSARPNLCGGAPQRLSPWVHSRSPRSPSHLARLRERRAVGRLRAVDYGTTLTKPLPAFIPLRAAERSSALLGRVWQFPTQPVTRRCPLFGSTAMLSIMRISASRALGGNGGGARYLSPRVSTPPTD